MELLIVILLALFSYLIGSLPSAVWIGNVFHNLDIRDFGSGNAGATNTFRVLGKKAGLIVMFLDVLKGFTATSLVLLLGHIEHNSDKFVNIQLLFGMCAVLGHIFPIYVKFKGGKGIATLFGMIIAIHYFQH